MTDPNILFCDIETSLSEVYTHYIGNKVSVSYKQILKESKIISISYSWNKTSKYEALHWNDGDDSLMLEKFNKIAAEADFICGHNAQGFDIKEIRAAIALRGLATSWCETPVIDTLSDYRRVFRFKSNRLDAIARSLGLGFKDPMSMEDWIKLAEGVFAVKLNNILVKLLGSKLGGRITYIATLIAYPKCSAKNISELLKQYKDSLLKMVKYNKQDVRLLKNVYYRLDRYVSPSNSRINRALQRHNIKCPTCQGVDIVKYGRYTYNKQAYQKYLCKTCSKVLMPEKNRS